MKINKNSLMLIAGILWIIAGFFVIKIGVPIFITLLKDVNIYIKIMAIVFSVIIFLIFYKKIFLKLVNKHTLRIKNNIDIKMEFWKFFDLKSYIIMIVMVFGGIIIRKFALLPMWFIGTFYTGLGSALFLAGINFAINFIKKKVLD